MKSRLKTFLLLLLAIVAANAWAAEPLRVFIRSGVKTHGPGAHDHPSFLRDWVPLLNSRGAKAEGSLEFPSAAQLDATDVVIFDTDNGGDLKPEQRELLEKFVKRGGGIVVIHAASVSKDTEWWKSMIGGSWSWGTTKWLEGPMSLYYADGEHPITRGVSNFDLDDEIYYDMELALDVRVLAAAYTPNITSSRNNKKAAESTAGGKRVSVYDIQPQMWTYEKDNHRAFVSIPGHYHKNFSLPHYRAVVLRGIAWAGKRANVDALCTKDELASLRYPEGGPSAPEKTLAKTVVHPDFKMSLIAAEPLINKAINIDWDAQGRLWVAETPEYPNGRREPNTDLWKDSGHLVKTGNVANRPARDRISILTDTDGDGIADKKEIFYEGLELVTSFVFYKDGVIACAAPDIWSLRDTNGDGKADKVEKLYTGLGTNDTHAVINNLRWGFDGWVYATLGYSAGHPTSPDGSKDFGRVSSGVVRFKPDGSAFEQVSSKGGNTWGLDIAWDNEIFYTQPTSGDLLMHVVLSEGVLARGKIGNTASFKPLISHQKIYPLLTYEQQAYVQIDQVGSFTAAAGCAIYDGGSWPKEWNYSYFTDEPTVNIVNHELITPDGATFAAHKQPRRDETEFMQGRDYWWRPIEARVGPDGALYIIDWYNQAVIHNDTRGVHAGPANAAVRPDRDHYFGRIWRVDHKQAKKLDAPNLTKAAPAELVKALEHPNRHVRMNAFRLLAESGAGVSPALQELAGSQKPAEARVPALWALHRLGKLNAATLTTALNDSNAAMRKNALQIVSERPDAAAQKEIAKRLQDTDPRVRLEAIVALGSIELEPDTARALVQLWSALQDAWSQSALVGVGAKNSVALLDAAFTSENPAALAGLVTQLSQILVQNQDAAQAAKLVIALATKPASADVLKQSVLETFARSLKRDTVPAWSSELQSALRTLLTSSNPAVAGAVLPLAARWDKGGALAAEVKQGVQTLAAKLKETGQADDTRAAVVGSLLGVRQLSADILPSVASLLTGDGSGRLKKRVVELLGATGDPAAGKLLVQTFPKLDRGLQGEVFSQLLKRADFSLALLDALQAKTIEADDLGPANLFRLRTHANRDVSKRANKLIDELRGPEAKQKDELIAKFTPIVTQPGNLAVGKELFTQNCSPCHKLGDIGKDVAPALTGMGAHGPAALLVHVLDPNREVDPSFIATSIETKDDESFDGIVARENPTTVTLKNAQGEKDIPVAQIASRRSTGRSLMPEGFESLGGEKLRDILAFLCGGESRFRIVNLKEAFTADSRRGIYQSEDKEWDSLHFAKFGVVTVEGVPFNIVDAAKSTTGRNLVVLKGGGKTSFAHTFPVRVEAKFGFAAAKLHFLGGVAGWGYPFGGKDRPAMKVTVVYADGQKEEMELKNGEEFADYIRVVDVPGSKLTEGVVVDHQLRWFTKPLARKAVIEKLVLECYDNGIAVTTVAITAELAEFGNVGGASAPRHSVNIQPSRGTEAPPTFKWIAGTKVLVVGGGTSHDFNKWFNEYDVAMLRGTGKISANYTDNVEVAVRELPRADVLLASTNQKGFDTPAFRKALFDFAAAGKGIVLLHPGVWYNWNDWPEYNRVLAGGGSRGHDKPAEFEVTVTAPNHPLMAGVPAKFKITDELYWFETDPQGTPIETLATTHSPSKDKDFPMVWIVKHPQARIVGIALGHDGRAHELEAFKIILKNSVAWAAKQ